MKEEIKSNQNYKNIDQKNFLNIFEKIINDLYENNKSKDTNSLSNSNQKSLDIIKNIFNEICKDDNLSYNFINIKEGVMKYILNIKSMENSYEELSNLYLQKKYKKERLRYNHYKSTQKLFKNLIYISDSERISSEVTIIRFEDEIISIFFSFFLIISIRDLKKKILNYNSNDDIHQAENSSFDEKNKYKEKDYENVSSSFTDKKDLVDGSKYQLLSELTKNIDFFFLLVSNSFRENIDLSEGDKDFYGHLILFLSSGSYIEKKTNKRYIKNKPSYATEFMLKKKTEGGPVDRWDEFCSFLKLNQFDCKIYETAPILYQNKYYSSSNVSLQEYFFIPTNVLNISSVVSFNSKYGYLNNGNKKTTKGFLAGHDSPILNFIKDQVNKKKKIDTKIFKEVFDYFVDTKIKLSVDIETPIEKVIELKNHYPESSSNDNKNWMHDILKLIELKHLYEIHKKQGFFYLSFFFDFRSRLYYHSLISLTNFKLSRFFLTEDDYTKPELLKIVSNSVESEAFFIFLNFYINQEKCLKNYGNDDYFNEKYSEFTGFNDYKKSLLVSNIVDLGVLNKSKILKKKKDTTSCYIITISEFFEEGLEVLNNSKIDKNYFENLKKKDSEFYFKTLQTIRLITEPVDLYKKIYIGLDFSASGHQLRYLTYGFKDIKSYEVININSPDNSWTDIYTLLIFRYKMFINENVTNGFVDILELKDNKKSLWKHLQSINSFYKEEKNLDSIFKYFTRSILKKSIMTVEYNVTLITFLDYFEKSLKQELLDVESIEKENATKILKNLRPFIMAFYHFCKDFSDLDNYISLTDNSSNFENMLKELGYKITHFDGFTVPLAVFKKSKKEERIVCWYRDSNMEKKNRITLVIPVYSSEIDVKKTLSSLMPNYIHSKDAVILRSLIYFKWWSYSSFYTVHDEYWLPFQEKFLFVDHVNFFIKRDLMIKITKNVYSIDNVYQAFKNKKEFEKDLSELFKLTNPSTLSFYSLFVII